MRVIFTKNHHVQVGARSRRMYKRGSEYEVADEVGRAAIGTKSAKAVAEAEAASRRPAARSAPT
jgi:hypothetical protein